MKSRENPALQTRRVCVNRCGGLMARPFLLRTKYGQSTIEDGSIEAVLKLLTEAMHGRLRDHFDEVINAKTFTTGDVTAGRAFVKAYVEFSVSTKHLRPSLMATSTRYRAGCHSR